MPNEPGIPPRSLLGADDPEDIAQEAFARPIRKYSSLRSPDAALAAGRGRLHEPGCQPPTWLEFYGYAHENGHVVWQTTTGESSAG